MGLLLGSSMNQSLMVSFFFYEPIEFVVLFDWIMLSFMVSVLLISLSIFLFSKIYVSYFLNKRFILLLFLFVLSMLLIVSSPNLVSMLVGWDGLGFSSFCLVAFYQNDFSMNNSMITMLTNRLGDSLLIISSSLLFFYNSFSVNTMYLQSLLISSVIFLGAITKSAQFPFSIWLPAAMAAPTPVSSLVHSSTLVTAGIYLLIRFHKLLEKLSSMTIGISIITSLISGIMAVNEMDAKKLIALSTLSQLGVMMTSLILLMWKFSFFHLLTHAMFKSLMFMSFGTEMNYSFGNQGISFFSNLIHMNSLTFLFMSGINLVSIPFMSGFFSKDLILEGLQHFHTPLFFMFLGVCVTSCLYSIRLLTILFSSKKTCNTVKEESFLLWFKNSPLLIFMLALSLGAWLFYHLSYFSVVVFFYEKVYAFILLPLMVLTFLVILKESLFFFLSWGSKTLLNFSSTSFSGSIDLTWLESIGPQHLTLLFSRHLMKMILIKKTQLPLLLILLFI